MRNQVCVIGQGYVGLTLSAVMAEVGFEVLGLEEDEEKLAAMKENNLHVEEPELDTTIATQRQLGNLEFARDTDVPTAKERTVYIVAVGSPLGPNKRPDVGIVRSAVESVASVLDEGDLVILRSTIPPGTTQRMAEVIEESSGLKPGEEFLLAHAPERTLQGSALAELRGLPQVIGGYDERSADVAEDIFRKVNDTVIRVDSARAAEMVKLMDNTYRDVSIALGNAFGELARAHGLDGQSLIAAANKGYGRNDIKQPGAGVGGGCLPKDPYLLLDEFESDGHVAREYVERLISTARSLNEEMPHVTVAMIEDAIDDVGHPCSGLDTVVLGAAFKGQPATNDIRHTPAGPIIEAMNKHGAVDAFDPNVEDEKIRALGAEPVDVPAPEKLTELVVRRDYDVVVIANNNPVFKEIDLFRVQEERNGVTILVDGWGLYSPQTVENVGLKYVGVGRSPEYGQPSTLD
ncbi:nucleotide sugar dehydrogenase [Salinibacter ruber]|uniref:nucleotide sugar dehydrogenase n=1 Tax=Salinibacter ruber TaxID=146919 RepID=UPI0021679A20|nr:nucleotide sugar dehydrogenase [Salinibacter ruber]MCS4150712.1 UDP-N-acetyl-D-mannosaminuronic acid dehydrogenase [Salinibacter ruber]